MIEVLVSLVVVAFGLLGLAGLQARSMSFQKDSFDRKSAAEMVSQLVERARGNFAGFQAGDYDRTLTPGDATAVAVPACADPLNCTPVEVATRDWAMWQIDLRRRLPTSGAYLTSAEVNGRRVNLSVTLAWQEGQPTDVNQVDPICSNAPVNINDPTFRCMNWVIIP
jgi:type IV pilus assembly protein PilV